MSSRNRYLRLQLALRGLIGNGPELDSDLEKVRTEILCIGIEHESSVKINQAIFGLFGSMEQHESGGITPGKLTELRQDVAVDYLESLAPYRDFSSWRKKKGGNEEDERKKFIQSYQEWAEGGKAVESDSIECTFDEGLEDKILSQ